MDKIGKYLYLTEPFHCDFSHRLFMSHLGNHLLNASDSHANERGFGMTLLNPMHKTWVLSRLAVEMEDMPRQYSSFFVETWIEGVMRSFINRDYRISSGDGRTFGYARSVWALIDATTRQPEDVLSMCGEGMMGWGAPDVACPIAKSSRVKMTAGAEVVRTIGTFYNDVDVNGHVNSIKYIEHILDLFSLDWHRAHRLQRFDIAYVAESYGGDSLTFRLEQTGEGEYCIGVSKCVDSASGGVEVCRCKVKFINK